MSILWADGDTADPVTRLITAIQRCRAWYRRWRADRFSARLEKTHGPLYELRRLEASPAIRRTVQVSASNHANCTRLTIVTRKESHS
jgi:hypothetical protein